MSPDLLLIEIETESEYLRLGDLIGFEGYLNVSTPFNRREHNALWKGDRRYNDFAFGNNELPYCEYPRFYGDDGKQVLNLSTELVGCRDSEFDQYGEVAAFGIYPEWYVYLLDWLSLGSCCETRYRIVSAPRTHVRAHSLTMSF